MRQDYTLDAGALRPAAPEGATVSVYTAPTPDELRELTEVRGLDPHTLASALDPDEIARLEVDRAGHLSVIWKRPDRVTPGGPQLFEVSSVGIFLRGERLTLVTARAASPLVGARLAGAASPRALVPRLMAGTVGHFVGHLRAIKQMSREIQGRLSTALENRHLLRMFDLSESLVYYVDAIEGNGAALAKLRGVAERAGFTEGEVALLDDVIVDNAQCGRQGHIYVTVLAGLLDARGNIVNNNMNVLLKKLTVINVVFLPLGVIAGILGMSEFTMMVTEARADWRAAYLLFTLTLIVLGVVLWAVLKRWVDGPNARAERREASLAARTAGPGGAGAAAGDARGAEVPVAAIAPPGGSRT